MSDFTTVITDQGVLDASQIEVWAQGVILAADEMKVVDQLVSQRQMGIKAATATFIKFANLDNATSALSDGVDPTSVAITDSEVNLTLTEYGNVVTTTSLGDISSGGRANPGAIELIGKNMGTSMDVIGIQVLEAGTSETIVTQSAESSLTSSDIITTAYVEKMYNKLRRNKIPKLLGNYYAAVIHPDVVSDLRNQAAAGDWVDVNKYSNAMVVLNNEVGIFKGFRVFENANITINTDAGDAAVDTYHSLFLGYNALAYAESLSPGLRITGPYDKLGRLLNFGWYGVCAYGIVDQNACQILTSASSFGTN